MKISVDGQELYELLPYEITLLKNDLLEEGFTEDMERRLEWVTRHTIDTCAQRIYETWTPVLEADPSVKTIPLDKQVYLERVMAHPAYKNRSERDAERQAIEDAKLQKATQ